MSDIQLEVRDIAKRFGAVAALDSVSLTLRRGRVHTLLGENGAGKSTLMKILAGLYAPDRGTLLFDGRPVTIRNPAHARALGIATVFQELSLSNNMTVAENIYANHEPARCGFIRDGQMVADCRRLLTTLGIDTDPYQQVGALSLAQRQLVEIAKALSFPASVVIMDEPTSSLSDGEAGILFGIIDRLKARGCAVVYISHRMDEIMRVSDDITVLRDGAFIATHQRAQTTIAQLIAQMVGREMKNVFPPRLGAGPDPGAVPLLDVRHLSHPGQFSDISFSVRAGEVLGFFGLVGSGRSDVMKGIFGVTRCDGDIVMAGKPVAIRSPGQAIAQGIAFVTENRKEEGLVLSHDVNLNLQHIAFQHAGPLINRRRERQTTREAIRRMRIRVSSPYQRTGTLSGGNQQKIVLAKWLQKKTRVLILDEPTRGVDVGAKYEIYQTVRQLAVNGTAIVFISSELPEVMALSDRLAVMRAKRIVDIYPTANLTPAQVISAATGVA